MDKWSLGVHVLSAPSCTLCPFISPPTSYHHFLYWSLFICFLLPTLPISHASMLQPDVWLSFNPASPRSVQPVCAVRAVGQLQARTGTSSGLEITASAPGARSSMRKVGPGRKKGLGDHGRMGQALDEGLTHGPQRQKQEILVAFCL